jgi:hypothetical protein
VRNGGVGWEESASMGRDCTLTDFKGNSWQSFHQPTTVYNRKIEWLRLFTGDMQLLIR